MNFPTIDILALFTRYQRDRKPDWSRNATRRIRRIRTSHARRAGDDMRAYYTVETRDGKCFDLEYDSRHLIWELTDPPDNLVLDNVVAHFRRSSRVESLDHLLIPYWFQLIDKQAIASANNARIELTDRMEPFRFLLKTRFKPKSHQVKHIRSTHLENIQTDRHLHYLAETEEGRYFSLVYSHRKWKWHFIQEVDEQFLFSSPG